MVEENENLKINLEEALEEIAGLRKQLLTIEASKGNYKEKEGFAERALGFDVGLKFDH